MDFTEEKYYFLQERERCLWSRYGKDERQVWRQGRLGECCWDRVAVVFKAIHKLFAIEILKSPCKR